MKQNPKYLYDEIMSLETTIKFMEACESKDIPIESKRDRRLLREDQEETKMLNMRLVVLKDELSKLEPK